MCQVRDGKCNEEEVMGRKGGREGNGNEKVYAGNGIITSRMATKCLKSIAIVLLDNSQNCIFIHITAVKLQIN
jgi:hypothetical protein